jgi:NitT/TauT family transport system permease protein
MKKKGIHPESGLSSARALRRFALLICLVIAWEGLGRFLELRTDMVPTPSRVALEAFRHASELQRHLLSTVSGAGAGLALALLVALPAGLAGGSSPEGLRYLRPLVGCLRMVPLVALLPIFLVWFGYGTAPRLAMVFLVSFLAVLAAAARAGGSISQDMLDLFRTMGASRAQTLFRLRIPVLLPELVGNLRGTSVTALAAAVTAEFVEGDEGIGYLMLSAISRMNTPLLFASFLSVAFVGVVSWVTLGAVLHALLPWNVEQDRGELP